MPGLWDGDPRRELLEESAGVAELAHELVGAEVFVGEKHEIALRVAIQLDDLAFCEVAPGVDEFHACSGAIDGRLRGP